MTLRIVSRTARSIHEREREIALRKREAAGTLATAFPRCEAVRIHLSFVSDDRRAPAARTHELFPSAHAFFEFTCPYGDCDGSIDLSDAVVALLRTQGTQHDGVMHCPGSRLGVAGGARHRCKQRVDYWIVVRHQALARNADHLEGSRRASRKIPGAIADPHKSTQP